MQYDKEFATQGCSHLESGMFSSFAVWERLFMVFLSLSSSAANRHFLRSMARVGAGCEEFFDSKTKSKWERKVKSQLSKAFQPALTSVSVEWQQFDDNTPKPVQVI